MHLMLLVALLIPPNQANGSAAPNPVQAGKAVWEEAHCKNCHGVNGEGAFGPDLAGRGLSAEQFTQAVRKPWGVMPAFDDKNISNEELTQLAAYFSSLPRRSQPGPWRFASPQNAKTGQALMIATAGCGQCHGTVMANPRSSMGGEGADANFEWFKKMVYEHTTLLGGARRLHMGNFNRERLPEPLLQEIWHYISVDAGFRVPIRAQLGAGTHSGNDVSYTLTVTNVGVAGKGLTAEDVSIAIQLPPGAKVANAGGATYKGVRHDAQANVDTAVWQVAKLGPTDKVSCTITLTGTGAGAPIAKGTVGWAKPAQGDGTPDQVLVTVPAPAGSQ